MGEKKGSVDTLIPSLSKNNRPPKERRDARVRRSAGKREGEAKIPEGKEGAMPSVALWLVVRAFPAWWPGSVRLGAMQEKQAKGTSSTGTVSHGLAQGVLTGLSPPSGGNIRKGKRGRAAFLAPRSWIEGKGSKHGTIQDRA